MMSKPTNDWTKFLRVTTLATTFVQNVQLLYRKLTSRHSEPIGFYSEVIHDWEQFLEFCFEIADEKVEPIIVLLEFIKAMYNLKEYSAFLALGVDIHLNKAMFEEYKSTLETNQMNVKLGLKTLPKIDNFIFHQGFAKQVHELNEAIINKRISTGGKLTGLLKGVLEDPWRIVELVRLFRPLILMILIYLKKGTSSVPLFTGLSIDLLSIFALHMRKTKSELHKVEMKRRCLGLLKYIMYNPVHEFLLGKLSSSFSPQSVFVALLSYYKCYSLIL